jgi:SAM-dependent methyltransferase
VLVADDPTRAAMHAMEEGRRDEALASLLGLDASAAGRLHTLLESGTATYRDALDIISPDAEGTYFVYRFSDPTFVLAETLVRAIGADRRRTTRVLDLCGGSGHLTRVLGQLSDQPVVVADVYYWKLWLAQRFTAPGCAPVCCDANHPLPFAAGACSLVVLSDAFPYIWHKRLLAGEMLRLAGETGTILMPHLHSSLGFNFSAGMTLTPAAYRDLFAPAQPRLFRDSDLLGDILGHTAIDLSRDVTPEQAGDEPSVTLVATRDGAVFRKHPAADPGALTGELCVNPLYRVEQHGAQATLTLAFPTAEYEEEFGAVRRYLPDTLTLDADLRGALTPAHFGAAYTDLRRRRVLLDTPPHYC